MIGFGMGLGLLILILIFGGVFLLAIWLVKALFPASQKPLGPPTDRDHNPHEILDRRYASGAITKDQYERMKVDLAN